MATEVSTGVERIPTQPLEAPYVGIVKKIVHEKIPDHTRSFDITLNAVNEQITGNGLFTWQSKDQPGVGFLAGHLSIDSSLIYKIAGQSKVSQETEDVSQEQEEQRLGHYVYVIEPSFGLGEDGSALSALDMGIARFINEMPRVARAIRAGEKPPTVDIYMVGGPTALGGHVTPEFAEKVKANGFSEYGRLYAEFLREQLSPDAVDSTRIVLQGASKGAITSDQTIKYLPQDMQERTQLLYDNPAGTHGKNIPTQIGRSINMGAGMAAELAIRQFAGSVRNGAFAGQKEFYRAISRLKGIPQDSDEQARLKKELFLKGEIGSLAKGTPLDSDQRSFSRISTPDPVNVNFRNIVRVMSAPVTERIIQVRDRLLGRKIEPRRALTVKEHGRKSAEDYGLRKDRGGRLAFATGNTVHNFPWVRSIDSGSWAQKMSYVENTKLPASAS